jgi:GT2 family glycosyltransferase
MSQHRVSVVIVSRDRPEALNRCLTGVSQLRCAQVEIVVVACPAGAATVSARKDASFIKLVPFDEANISAARNLGIAASAGDIVAFIDDDAVPEPNWLAQLTAPFDDPGIAATGGYVIGRNGLSFQWKARSIDETGEAHAIDIAGEQPTIPSVPTGHSLKTEGTNMSVRREVLQDLGGFDPSFHFYLDETDLNVRLAQAGYHTMICPMAQVHHGFAASPRRDKNRIPLDLSEIAASKAVFLRKHCPEDLRPKAMAEFYSEQRLRLLRLMRKRALRPDDVDHLLKGLQQGLQDGQERVLADKGPLPPSSKEFLTYPTRPDAQHIILAGRIWQAHQLKKQAKAHVAEGNIVSLVLLSPTTLYHRESFTSDGYWLRHGGLWGRGTRSDPLIQLSRFKTRVQNESKRMNDFRELASK